MLEQMVIVFAALLMGVLLSPFSFAKGPVNPQDSIQETPPPLSSSSLPSVPAAPLDAEKEATATIETLSPQLETLNIAQLKKLAHAYGVQNNHWLAIKVYNLGRAKNKNDVEILTLLAHEQLLAGKDREALANLKEAQERNPKYDPLYLELDALYRKKKN